MNPSLLRLLVVLVGCLSLGACLIETSGPEEVAPAETEQILEWQETEDAELDAILDEADARIAATPEKARVGEDVHDHDHDHSNCEGHDHDHDHGEHDQNAMEASQGADR